MTRTKSVDAAIRKFFGGQVRRWVAEKYDSNQSAAGRALGCSQGHISALINGSRGVGLPFLLLFREATGKPLDELLGLAGGSPEEERIRQMLREELARLQQHEATPLKERTAHASKPRPARHSLRRSVRE